MHKEVKYIFSLVGVGWLLMAVMIALDEYGYSEYSWILYYLFFPVFFLGCYFAAKHIYRVNKEFLAKIREKKAQQTDQTTGS